MSEIFDFQKKNLISLWLISCLSLIILIIFIGGLTRLTHSGLSIVEWKPITGIIPPLNHESWQEEFLKYQSFPEYKHLHYNISIIEFKKIYYLEYIHRLLGRIIALVFILPFIIFWKQDTINPKQKKYFSVITILLLLQGVIGWYMVKSGLTNQPYISHYRLALHLMMAIIIYSILFFQYLDIKHEIILSLKRENFTIANRVSIITLFLTYIQIILGALLAGLKGGQLYNSFPMMGDHFISPEIVHSSWQELILFNDPVFVQFAHRINAFILVAFIIILFVILIKCSVKKLTRLGIYILIITIAQFLLGVLTLLYSVPTDIALTHQIGSIILLSYLLYCYYLVKKC